MTTIHYRILAAGIMLLLAYTGLLYKSNSTSSSQVEPYNLATQPSHAQNVGEYSHAVLADKKIAAQTGTEAIKKVESPIPRTRDQAAASTDKPANAGSENSTAAAIPKNPPDASFFVKSDYADYDDHTLANLISTGDTIAMQIMATRLLGKGGDDNLAQAKDLLEQSIIRGDSYYPIQLLAEQKSIAVLAATIQGLPMEESSKRASLVDTFAYYELGALRGDDTLKRSMTQVYAEQYKLSPTAEEWEAIRKKSVALQQQLELKGRSLGL